MQRNYLNTLEHTNDAPWILLAQSASQVVFRVCFVVAVVFVFWIVIITVHVLFQCFQFGPLNWRFFLAFDCCSFDNLFQIFLLGMFTFINHPDMHFIMFSCDQVRISSIGASKERCEPPHPHARLSDLHIIHYVCLHKEGTLSTRQGSGVELMPLTG